MEVIDRGLGKRQPLASRTNHSIFEPQQSQNLRISHHNTKISLSIDLTYSQAPRIYDRTVKLTKITI